jgi:hypothetical protein
VVVLVNGSVDLASMGDVHVGLELLDKGAVGSCDGAHRSKRVVGHGGWRAKRSDMSKKARAEGDGREDLGDEHLEYWGE